MSDGGNPRDHDDGDLALGCADDRDAALDRMLQRFLDGVAQEGMFSERERYDALIREARRLRDDRNLTEFR